MPRRRSSGPLALALRFALCSAASVAAVACSNLSLSASDDGVGAPVAGYHDSDAAIESGSASGLPVSSADSGTPPGPALVGSALCNYSYSSDANHNCRPDDSSQCSPIESDASTGASDAGAYADAFVAPIPGACHVVKSTNGSPTQSCAAAGPGGDGEQCQTGADCAADFECVGSPGRCRHYCCDGETSCSDGKSPTFCDVQPIAWSDPDAGADAGAAFQVPVCVPVVQCKLLVDGACPVGQTCAIVKDDGTPSCIATGPQQVGDRCDVDHCASGLTCLGSQGARRCYQLCRVGMAVDCPSMQTCTGSAQLFRDPADGICQ